MKPPLPSTTDDISPSDIRRHPLSSEELCDIRSLIGVAKKGSSIDHGASKQSGADVNTTPQKPLAGRRVMVPMTSKAFFEGMLQPSQKNFDSTAADDDVAMNEQIIVKDDGGNFVKMTRAEACVFFGKQQQRDATPKKSSIKPSKIKSKEATHTTASAPAKGEMTHETPSVDPMLPLLEIRETCDVSGNIISSEVVNMSNTMKRLGDGINDVDGEDDGKQLGELIAQTLKEGEGDIIAKDLHSSYENDEDDKQEVPKQNKLKEPISDSEYEAICSRLEDLERLEEEDAKSKRRNAKSSKRLQSSGWSKGFLNNTKKKSALREKASAKNQDATLTAKADEIPADSSTAAEVTQKSDSARVSFSGNATAIPKPDSTISSGKMSRVSFSSDDKIKEIPRIGSLKVPPRPTSLSRPVTFNPAKLEVPEIDPFSPVSTAPFEENVFRGVVKERNNNSTVGREVKETASKSENSASGKKKLSRFAQQRLQRE